MLGSRREGTHSTVALIRDIVEIVAILLAGLWAIYTFVFVEQIKPALEQPSLVMNGSLRELGERNGLAQFSYSGVIRNNGLTRVYLIAEGFTVTGFRMATTKPVSLQPYNGSHEYDRDARVASENVIYRRYSLTRYADPNIPNGFDMGPGQELPFNGIFAVKKGEFDSIALHGSIAYAKDGNAHPTHVGYTIDKAVYFEPAQDQSNYYNFEITLDRASLW